MNSFLFYYHIMFKTNLILFYQPWLWNEIQLVYLISKQKNPHNTNNQKYYYQVQTCLFIVMVMLNLFNSWQTYGNLVIIELYITQSLSYQNTGSTIQFCNNSGRDYNILCRSSRLYGEIWGVNNFLDTRKQQFLKICFIV